MMRIHWQVDVADTIAFGVRDKAKGSEVGATSPIYQQAKLRTCDGLYQRVGPAWYWHGFGHTRARPDRQEDNKCRITLPP